MYTGQDDGSLKFDFTQSVLNKRCIYRLLNCSDSQATDTVVQHLDFTGAEKEGEGEMGRLTARLVELSTRAEDLQFQLNTAEQELVEVRGRADETEVTISYSWMPSSSLMVHETSLLSTPTANAKQ